MPDIQLDLILRHLVRSKESQISDKIQWNSQWIHTIVFRKCQTPWKIKKICSNFPSVQKCWPKNKNSTPSMMKSSMCHTYNWLLFLVILYAQEIYISGQNSVKMSPQKCCRLATKIVENHWTFAPQSKASQQKSGKNKFHFLDMTSSEFCTYSCHAFLTIWCAQMTKFRQIL